MSGVRCREENSRLVGKGSGRKTSKMIVVAQRGETKQGKIFQLQPTQTQVQAVPNCGHTPQTSTSMVTRFVLPLRCSPRAERCSDFE
jgi:hypothetical protein